MSEATFGERLAEARRTKCETIEEVSEQLRIRPSIILAMETSNFAHMPHKGYARNMVSSYARYLGLDSTHLTEQFLREFRRWETSANYGSAGSNANSLMTTSRRFETGKSSLTKRENAETDRETITAAGRAGSRGSVWGRDDSQQVDRDFKEQLRQRKNDRGSQAPYVTARQLSPRQVEEAPSRSVRNKKYVGKPPRKSLFSGVASTLSSRPALIAIGLAVVFLVILILWAVLASTCARNDTAAETVRGVTASDNVQGEDAEGDTTTDTTDQVDADSQYGPFELVVEVVEGESWLQIDVDSTTPVGEVCTAPWSGTYTVSSSCTIQAGAPSAVKVYRNGVEVPLDTSTGTGYLELAVEQRPIVQNAQDADTNSQG